MASCLICQTLIREEEARCRCPECQQDYHQSCWDQLGGCATYGCVKAVPAEKPPPPVRVGGGWGDTKSCPKCKRTLRAELLICRCGARFPHADPMTPEEYRELVSHERALKVGRRSLVLLFLVSLAGIPAPLFGLVAGGYAYAKRHELAGVDGTYLAMGYGAAALGCVYIVIVLLLLVGL